MWCHGDQADQRHAPAQACFREVPRRDNCAGRSEICLRACQSSDHPALATAGACQSQPMRKVACRKYLARSAEGAGAKEAGSRGCSVCRRQGIPLLAGAGARARCRVIRGGWLQRAEGLRDPQGVERWRWVLSSPAEPCIRPIALTASPRRGGRVVDCTALEMRHTRKGIGSSNLPLSAI